MAERTLPWWRKVLDYALSGIRSFLRPAKPGPGDANTSPASSEEPLEDRSELTQSLPNVEAVAAPPAVVEEPVPASEVQVEHGAVPAPTLEPVPEPELEPEPVQLAEVSMEAVSEPTIELEPEPQSGAARTTSEPISSEPAPLIAAEVEEPALAPEPQQAADSQGIEEVLNEHDLSLPNVPGTTNEAFAPAEDMPSPSPQIQDMPPAPEPNQVVTEIAVPIEPVPSTIDREPDPANEAEAEPEEALIEIATVPEEVEPLAVEPVQAEAETFASEFVEVHAEPSPEPEPVEVVEPVAAAPVAAELIPAVEESSVESFVTGHDFSRDEIVEGEPPPGSPQIADSLPEPELGQAVAEDATPIEPAVATIDEEPQPVAENLIAQEDESLNPRTEPTETPEEETLPDLHETQEPELQSPETPEEAISPDPVVEPEELPQVEPVEQAIEPAETPIDSSIEAHAEPILAQEALAAPEQTIAQIEPDPSLQPEASAAVAEAQPEPDEEVEPEAPKLSTPPAPAPKTDAELKTAARITAAIKAREEGPDPSPFSILVDQVYDGPLDLLLDLIRKQDIDIYDIPIAKITAQFLAYVNQLKAGDVDVAGEFIYTASLLIHIKSKMLLPRTATGPDEAAEDPRRELVERLLEHERFKNAAQMLQQKQMLEAATWTNPGVREFQDDVAAEPEIAADTVDLVRIFRDILERARNRPVMNVQEDSVTVGQMIQFLTRRLTMEDKPVSLSKLLANTKSERALIAMFLALLELVRMQAILLRQDRHFTDIFIKKNSGFDAVVDQGLASARDDWR